MASNLREQNKLVIDLSLDNKMQYFDNFNEWLSLEKTNSKWLNFLLSVFYENIELRNSENYIVFVLAQFIKEAQKEKKEIICIQKCSEVVDLENQIIFKNFFKDFSRVYISKNVNDNQIIPYFKKIYPGKEFGMMSYTRVNFSKLESSEFLEHYFPNLTLKYEDEIFLTKETHNNPNLFFEFVLYVICLNLS